MLIASLVVIFLIGLLHVYILVLEMFWWDKPRGLKAFGLSLEQAKASKTLAANQGLYNGFLAAGLFWGTYLGQPGSQVQLFFLSCVLIAGIYGGLTAGKRILLIQALPALIGLSLVVVRTWIN